VWCGKAEHRFPVHIYLHLLLLCCSCQLYSHHTTCRFWKCWLWQTLLSVYIWVKSSFSVPAWNQCSWKMSFFPSLLEAESASLLIFPLAATLMKIYHNCQLYDLSPSCCCAANRLHDTSFIFSVLFQVHQTHKVLYWMLLIQVLEKLL
jgi:hypothetical protein